MILFEFEETEITMKYYVIRSSSHRSTLLISSIKVSLMELYFNRLYVKSLKEFFNILLIVKFSHKIHVKLRSIKLNLWILFQININFFSNKNNRN
jgi:hypothetical protein